MKKEYLCTMGNRDTPSKKKIHNATYRAKHGEEIKARNRKAREDIKNEVLLHYGTCCVDCGFADKRALQIDHIRNDGNIERAKLGGKNFSGYRFYQWLKKQGWPDGYQTLCANCNIIKHVSNKNSLLV